MKRKILSVFTAICLITGALPMTMFAEDSSTPDNGGVSENHITRSGEDEVVGEYVVYDGENAQNAPVIMQVPSYTKAVVDFDMMLPSLKADNVTRNSIGGGNTGGVAFMQDDKTAGVIGFRGDSKGSPSNIISKGGQSGDYLNALGGSNASAPFDRWMHYTVIIDTENKTGNIYMTDPLNGKVYMHEGRFDRYIAEVEKITHIAIVSDAGYSIAVANLSAEQLKVSGVEIKAKEDADTLYIPYGDEFSTLEYYAEAFYTLTYNSAGEKKLAENVKLKNAEFKYSITDAEGNKVDNSKISVSQTGEVKVYSSADEGVYYIYAECENKISEGVAFYVKKAGNAHLVQVFGEEEIFTGESSEIEYKAILLNKELDVLPEKKAEWEIVGDKKGCSIDENGKLTTGNEKGRITVRATVKEDGSETKGELSVYIRDEKATVEIEGIVLKDTEAGFCEENAAWGILLNSSESFDNAVVEIKLFDKKDVLIKTVEKTVIISAGAESFDFDDAVAIEKASYARVKIFDASGELISSYEGDITKSGYKNTPLFADWIYGEKSSMARGIPSGIDPVMVNTDMAEVKYTYTDDYEKTVVDKFVDTNNLLWYKQGAFSKGASIYHRDGKDWEEMALPIGNGYMGAMIFGMPGKDHIQFNEETFWALGYRGVQEKKDPSFDNWQMGEGKNGYMNAGNVFVDFNIPTNDTVTNYYRDLNIEDSCAHVQYEYNGVTYNREYIASYPREVIAVKYTADKKGALNFTLGCVSAHPGDVTVRDGCIKITGRLKDSEQWYGITDHGQSDLEYCTIIKVVTDEQGEVFDRYGKVDVKNATEAVLYIAAATDYDENRFEFNPDGSVNMNVTPYKNVKGLAAAIEKAEKRLEMGTSVSYEKLKEEHTEDYKTQFDKVHFSLNDEICKTPTDELRASYDGSVWIEKDENNITRVGYDEEKYNSLNTHLESLHFNYARYLMISSSRANTMPANLQGKWCQSVAEIWGSCYCININMEMNYWFTGGANLSDSGLALVKWFNSQIPAGRVTAENMYNVTPKAYKMKNGEIVFSESDKDEDDVFIMHTKESIMGTTDMTGGIKIQSAGNLAWLMYNLWDLYLTSRDEELLENEIYPIMRKAANFYTQYLYTNMKRTTTDVEKYPDGYYYTTWAGRSPEHGPTHEGMKYDLQLVWSMFDYTIAAAEVLKLDSDKVKAWREIRDHLEAPVEIGDDGQIKEWAEETKYNMDINGNYLGDGAHRHISNLVGLYPGNLITGEELINGARIVLENRGDDATGWSCSNKFLLWARVKDGDKALELFRYQLAKKTYSNLFDTHSPFQIDGNFGSAAGVLELLMQSHTGIIDILPALPVLWEKGEISGIKAKNGATVSIKWEKGKAVEFDIVPVKSGDIEVGFGKSDKLFRLNGKYVKFNDGSYKIKNAVEGKKYTFVSVSY